MDKVFQNYPKCRVYSYLSSGFHQNISMTHFYAILCSYYYRKSESMEIMGTDTKCVKITWRAVLRGTFLGFFSPNFQNRRSRRRLVLSYGCKANLGERRRSLKEIKYTMEETVLLRN